MAHLSLRTAAAAVARVDVQYGNVNDVEIMAPLSFEYERFYVVYECNTH